jgi:hypothetical protein
MRTPQRKLPDDPAAYRTPEPKVKGAPQDRTREHHSWAGPGLQPGPPIATNARTLQRHGGPCSLCQWAMLEGQRIADMTDGGVAHVSCIAAAAL